MADIYLRSSDGSDASDGLTWADAKATLASAMTAAGAGGRVFVSSSHAETAASAKTLGGSAAATPILILSVDDTGNPQPPTALQAGASVTTTSTNNISFTGYAYCYGVTFNCGTTSGGANMLFGSNGAAWGWRFDTCTLAILSTNASNRLLIGSVSTPDHQILELINSNIQLSASGQGCVLLAKFLWRGGAFLATTPSLCFVSRSDTAGGMAYIEGVDFTAVGSGKAVVQTSAVQPVSYTFVNCKIGAGAFYSGTVPGWGGPDVEVINCAADDTNYRYARARYSGAIIEETTIVRTGGSSDGTTSFSQKMVTNANAQFVQPLESSPMSFWQEATGSAITVTVEVVTDNVTLTDAEAWIEVEYLGTSGFPLGVFIHDRATHILSTPANQISSSETWTTTGLTTPVKQKFSVTFTPQEKGLFRARVYLAKPSTTMYVDRKVTVT